MGGIEARSRSICNKVAFAGRLCFHSAMSATADLLRSAGVKVTPGRVRVLEALLAAAQPLSHADLDATLADADRVTLYRILDSLVTCGLALKAVDTRGIFRFSAAGTQHQHEKHVHFRCTDCGGVFCLKATPPPPPKLPRGFRLAEVALDVRGICADCARTDDER
jgi:Fur family ferric uptake transcriptional regulator